MAGIQLLEQAIRDLPVPSAPPLGSGEGSDIGLSFLDTSQRLNHVRRVTERIVVRQHGVITKTTEVDVSLDMLDSSQREASESYNSLTARTKSSEYGSMLWVPIARLPQSTSAPLEITDARGVQLSRLTQYDTSRLIAAGLYRLIRSVLQAQQADFTRRDTQLLLLEVEEARWLLESSIYSLLTARGRPMCSEKIEPTPHTAAGPYRRIKDLLIRAVSEQKDALEGFLELLEIACNDYLIVVGLNPRIDQHILRYESPISVTAKQPMSRLRSYLPINLNSYRIDYSSKLPSTLKSYHLVFEAEADVSVESVYLRTDSEVTLAKSLSSDLGNCADRLEEHASSPLRPYQLKYLEIEAQASIRAASEMYRRRSWEANLVGHSINMAAVPSLSALHRVVAGGEAALSADGEEVASILRHPLVSVESLRGAAEEILIAELGTTLSCAEGPPSSQSHTYWRRNAELRSGKSALAVEGRCVLRDGSESRPQRMVLYSLGMAALAWLIASFLAGAPWPVARLDAPPEGKEALVVLLLLVPGFLYSRLDLGDRGTISSRLRRLPRFTALAGVTSAAVAATAVASTTNLQWLDFMFTLAILTPMTTGAFLVLRARFETQTVGLSELDPSAWVQREAGSVPLEADVAVTSVFSGVHNK